MSATTSGTKAPGGRLSGADGVRAVAALRVVLYHLFQRLSLPDQAPWLQDVQLVVMKGSFGVSIFFVLSGMLLSLPFWRAHLTDGELPNVAHYVRRRVARIVPGFWSASSSVLPSSPTCRTSCRGSSPGSPSPPACTG